MFRQVDTRIPHEVEAQASSIYHRLFPQADRMFVPRAFEWLDKAVEAREWQVPLLKASPMFDRLRSDPRYPALLARVGLPGP